MRQTRRIRVAAVATALFGWTAPATAQSDTAIIGLVDATADYVLSFRFGSDPTVTVDRVPDVELRGSLGSAGNEDLDDLEIVLRTQLFDSPSRPHDIQTRILALTVTDRANRLVWQGRGTAAGAAEDDLAIVRVLASHLIDWIGTAAYQERVQ